VISAVLAGPRSGLTRQNLLDQRESSATARTYANAEAVRSAAASRGATDAADVLQSLQAAAGPTPC
jgi:hypothetical protein